MFDVDSLEVFAELLQLFVGRVFAEAFLNARFIVTLEIVFVEPPHRMLLENINAI